MPALRRLIHALSVFDCGPQLANPYAVEDPAHDRPGAAAARRANLEKYLRRLAAEPPSLLVIGEAAGYQGCRFSGIAFTSEFTLEHHAFFAGSGYQRSGLRERLWREPSGSIVWETAGLLGEALLLWNIVPFHPHRPGEPLSNRTPTRQEQSDGFEFLRLLRGVFPDARPVAAGKVASEILGKAGIEHFPVRHPAYGGKAEFQAGVLAAGAASSRGARTRG